jgi:hypothetical protein
MNVWFHIRTAATWLFGAVLLVAGALLVLQLAALLAWQYSVALETRAWPQLPILVVFADPAKLGTTTAQFMSVIPHMPWSWLQDPQNAQTLSHMAATWTLGKLHVGLIPAILGLACILLGLKLMRRQKQRYVDARRQQDDRLRRLRAYRREQRSEPVLTEFRAEPALSEPRQEPRLTA